MKKSETKIIVEWLWLINNHGYSNYTVEELVTHLWESENSAFTTEFQKLDIEDKRLKVNNYCPKYNKNFLKTT